MALEGSDVLVVQKQSGAQEVRKLSITQLQAFLDSGPVITFKGTANMTVSGDEPAVGDRVAGNLYVNSASTAGTFAWTGGTSPFTGTVQPNAQAIWVDTLGWQVTNNTSGDLGVESIQGTLPITIDSAVAASPIVAVNDATTTTSGVVTIATDQDVTDGTAGKVVTSAQLKTTNEAISNAGGGTVTNVTGTLPVVVTNGTSTPSISVNAAAVNTAGVVALEDASALDTTSTSTATTPKYVADFYLVSDFSTLPDISS
jgi:hypothetical protein